MRDIMELPKEELDNELRRMETDREDMEKKLTEFQLYREEREETDRRNYWQFQETREQMNSNDSKLLVLIEEGEQQLNRLRKQDGELPDSMQHFQKKKQLEWDMREEDIYGQINHLSHEEGGG